MMSACIFKDILRNHTQIFLEFRNPILRFVYISFNFNCTLDFLASIDAEQRRGNIKRNPASGKCTRITRDTDYSSIFFLEYQLPASPIYNLDQKMTSNLSMASNDSNVFYVEQSSSELSPQRHNAPNILNSTKISEQHTLRVHLISSIASPEPRIFTIDDDSNEPTMPYGFGRQLPIVPQSLNDLSLPPNPFSILNTMAIVTQTRDNNEQYSPESPEPPLPSPISTPPKNVSAYNSWEKPHTTTDDNTSYSEDEPRRVYWTSPLGETIESEGEPRRIYVLSPSPSPQPSYPRRQKRNLSLGMSFPKEGGVSQHVCEACGQTILSTKDIPGPSRRK